MDLLLRGGEEKGRGGREGEGEERRGEGNVRGQKGITEGDGKGKGRKEGRGPQFEKNDHPSSDGSYHRLDGTLRLASSCKFPHNTVLMMAAKLVQVLQDVLQVLSSL